MSSPKNLSNTWRRIPQKIFSCTRASANAGTACIRTNINSTRIISCKYHPGRKYYKIVPWNNNFCNIFVVFVQLRFWVAEGLCGSSRALQTCAVSFLRKFPRRSPLRERREGKGWSPLEKGATCQFPERCVSHLHTETQSTRLQSARLRALQQTSNRGSKVQISKLLVCGECHRLRCANPPWYPRRWGAAQRSGGVGSRNGRNREGKQTHLHSWSKTLVTPRSPQNPREMKWIASKNWFWKYDFVLILAGMVLVLLECRKWGCNRWGFKVCLASRPGNRRKSAFFALCLPFSPFSGGPEQHLDNPENGGKRPFSSEILGLA